MLGITSLQFDLLQNQYLYYYYKSTKLSSKEDKEYCNQKGTLFNIVQYPSSGEKNSGKQWMCERKIVTKLMTIGLLNVAIINYVQMSDSEANLIIVL